MIFEIVFLRIPIWLYTYVYNIIIESTIYMIENINGKLNRNRKTLLFAELKKKKNIYIIKNYFTPHSEILLYSRTEQMNRGWSLKNYFHHLFN